MRGCGKQPWPYRTRDGRVEAEAWVRAQQLLDSTDARVELLQTYCCGPDPRGPNPVWHVGHGRKTRL